MAERDLCNTQNLMAFPTIRFFKVRVPLLSFKVSYKASLRVRRFCLSGSPVLSLKVCACMLPLRRAAACSTLPVKSSLAHSSTQEHS